MDKSEIGFPITDNGISSTLYTQLIHANNGPMFSKAYTYDYDTSKGSQLDIISVSANNNMIHNRFLAILIREVFIC